MQIMKPNKHPIIIPIASWLSLEVFDITDGMTDDVTDGITDDVTDDVIDGITDDVVTMSTSMHTQYCSLHFQVSMILPYG